MMGSSPQTGVTEMTVVKPMESSYSPPLGFDMLPFTEHKGILKLVYSLWFYKGSLGSVSTISF